MSDLTPAAVALNLGITRDWVYVLLKSCALEGYQVGNKWRVEPAALVRFREKNRPADPNRIAPRSLRSIAALGRRAA